MSDILITGATGYLGSKLCSFLSKNGYDFSILTRNKLDYPNPFGLSKDKIISTEALYVDSSKSTFYTIIHCATKYNSENAVDLADINIGFPLKVASQYLLKGGLFINIDTSLVADTNLYAYTKNVLEQLLKKVAKTGEFRVFNLELQYFFDESEPENRFLKSLINACLANKTFKLTEGEQVRDFFHVDDLTRAVGLILTKSNDIEGDFRNIEIGSGNGISIKKLALLIKDIAESESEFIFGAIPYRENETMFAEADITFLNKLGWTPEYSLQEALKRTLIKMKKR